MKKENPHTAFGHLIANGNAKKIQITFENDMVRNISFVADFPQANMDEFIITSCLMDAHTHLFLSGTTHMAYRNYQKNMGETEIVQQIKTHIRRSMQYGIRAIRDMGSAADYLQKISVPNNFFITNTGPGYCVKGRYGMFVAVPIAMKDLPAQIFHRTETYPWIKIIQSGINSLSSFDEKCACQFTLDVLTDAVSIAHQKGVRVAAHANGEEAVRIAIDAGCDSIEHGYKMGKENLRRMADRQIHWIPTVVAMKNIARFELGKEAERENAKRYVDDQMEAVFHAREYGVPILAGSDAGSFGVYHGKGLWEEIQIFVKTGMRLEKAIECADARSAEFLTGITEFETVSSEQLDTFVLLHTNIHRFAETQIMPKEVRISGEMIQTSE